MHTHSNDVRDSHVVLLCGEVTEEMVEDFTGQFLVLDAKARRNGILIRITSHGGCAEAGVAIYDILAKARNRVTTEVWGMAESIAALIFQAGERRIMSPHSRLLLHDVQTESSSSTGSRGVQAHANDIKALEELYFRIMAERAGVKPAQIARWCHATTAFSAQEAVQTGLADGVMSTKGFKHADVLR